MRRSRVQRGVMNDGTYGNQPAGHNYGWHEFMAYMVARYPGYVDDFERLERLAPEADLSALKLLTQHEIAAIEFAGKEVAGEADGTAPLHRYLEQCMV